MCLQCHHGQHNAHIPCGLCVLVQMIKVCLGPLPFFKESTAEEEEAAAAAASVPAPIQKAVRPAVLADGSYATQTALPGAEAAPITAAAPGANLPNLRCDGSTPYWLPAGWLAAG